MIKLNASPVQELLLVRGHPGSGKSTLAQAFADLGYLHFENDSFFVDAAGVYTFNIAFHQEAKDSCVRQATQALLNGESVVVSNTFTKLVEMDSLVSFAVELGIPFRVIEMNNTFDNLHNVPVSVMEDKKASFEPFPNALQVQGAFEVL